jgi:hypothetical protein
LNKYNIRLPNGSSVERELEINEVEYWLSIGMYLAHGFHLLTTVFAAERMDDEANAPIPEQDEEVGLN